MSQRIGKRLKKKRGHKTDRSDIESQKERELSRGQAQSREEMASDRSWGWEWWCADPMGGEMVERPIFWGLLLCHLDYLLLPR